MLERLDARRCRCSFSLVQLRRSGLGGTHFRRIRSSSSLLLLLELLQFGWTVIDLRTDGLFIRFDIFTTVSQVCGRASNTEHCTPPTDRLVCVRGEEIGSSSFVVFVRSCIYLHSFHKIWQRVPPDRETRGEKTRRETEHRRFIIR